MASKRKTITLEVKREVIRRKDAGEGNSAIGRVLGLHEATVRTIYRKREDILKSVKAYGSSSFDDRKRVNPTLVKMERYLAIFISRKESEGVPIDKRYIKEQAKLFYSVICKRNNEPAAGFSASNGWLCRFLKRKNVRHVRLTGESHSADELAAQNFPQILRGIIDESEYDPECVYNMDECGLQYKKMPRCTYIAKSCKQARGRKIIKSRVTVLFCVNQTGSHKLKPLLVHTAKHPRCYRHLSDMKDVPVHWRSSQKAWVNSEITRDWFMNCFIPEVKRKCKREKRQFKILLTMDQCPAHPDYLDDLHPCVEVVFLPKNTTSLLQPLDQEIISNDKAKYHTRFQYVA